MPLYHYTKTETLPLILANRTIRFTRADLLDDASEVPFQTKHLDPKKFFVSSWSKGTHGEAGMWARYGDADRGVRLSLSSVLFPWSKLSIDVSRETGEFKEDGSPVKVGVRVCGLATPYDRATFFGNGYIAVPMGADLPTSFGAPVIYAMDPVAEAKRTVTLTETGMTFHGDGTRVARVKGMGWADQAEYRFVLSAVKGPKLDYAADPVCYENALVELIAAGAATGFVEFHPDIRYIDLPLAPNAFEALTVTLGSAMPDDQRGDVIRQVKNLVPSAKVMECALRLRQKL